MGYRRTMWLLAYYYLQGARRFDIFNPVTQNVQASYVDDEGNLEYQSQELLSAINRNAGRIAAMDLRPTVMRDDVSLASIRDRATAQIIADSLVSADSLEGVKTQFAYLFTCLGSCGVTGHIVDHPTIGLTSDLEVIHPKEIMPFPSLAYDYTKAGGLMRERVVPIPHLKEILGKSLAGKMNDMDWWEVQVGTSLEDGGATSVSQGFPSGMNPRADKSGRYDGKNKDKTLIQAARIRELWVNGPRQTCSRYIVASGDAILHDEDTSSREVYCPIGFERFYENGTFHGAGLFDVLFSVNRMAERMSKELFNNVIETDRYGYIVMPSGSWNERAALREVGKGMRVLPYEPDVYGESFRPFPVQPFNTGDVPGKTAAFATEMMDRVNPWRDLLKEKGRVDSAIGLQFLDEQNLKALTNPTRGVQMAFATAYKSMVGRARIELLTSQRPLPVGRLSLDLAGAVINPEESTVSFPQNPLPDISRLRFGVREQNPRSPVARKMESIELARLQKEVNGMADWMSFILINLEEGLDPAMWLKDYQASYESVIRNILLLYGDGTTPGEVVITFHNSKPDFQIRVLDSFMESPKMAVSSVDVQNAFIMYRETLLTWMGNALPQGTPNPDDLAMLMTPPEMGGAGPSDPNQQGGEGGPPQGAGQSGPPNASSKSENK
jgi:hypothetical protein